MPADKTTARLYLISTPIGAARDVTLHAMDLLKTLDVLVAEDTRVLRKLMDIHGIALDGRKILSFHDHSDAKDLSRVIGLLKDGLSVGYASDAGTPMIADPGFALVKAAREQGFDVEIAPGASALTAALALAGQPTDQVYFGGFLPNKTTARRKALESVADLQASLVFYESPKRVKSCVQDMVEVFGEDRPITLCRELTKKFQEISPMVLGALMADLEGRDSIKGEIVLVLGPPARKSVSLEDIGKELIDLVQSVGTKEASRVIGEKYGLPRKDVYNFALEKKS